MFQPAQTHLTEISLNKGCIGLNYVRALGGSTIKGWNANNVKSKKGCTYTVSYHVKADFTTDESLMTHYFREVSLYSLFIWMGTLQI